MLSVSYGELDTYNVIDIDRIVGLISGFHHFDILPQ